MVMRRAAFVYYFAVGCELSTLESTASLPATILAGLRVL